MCCYYCWKKESLIVPSSVTHIKCAATIVGKKSHSLYHLQSHTSNVLLLLLEKRVTHCTIFSHTHQMCCYYCWKKESLIVPSSVTHIKCAATIVGKKSHSLYHLQSHTSNVLLLLLEKRVTHCTIFSHTHQMCCYYCWKKESLIVPSSVTHIKCAVTIVGKKSHSLYHLQSHTSNVLLLLLEKRVTHCTIFSHTHQMCCYYCWKKESLIVPSSVTHIKCAATIVGKKSHSLYHLQSHTSNVLLLLLEKRVTHCTIFSHTHQMCCYYCWKKESLIVPSSVTHIKCTATIVGKKSHSLYHLQSHTSNVLLLLLEKRVTHCTIFSHTHQMCCYYCWKKESLIVPSSLGNDCATLFGNISLQILLVTA